MEGIQINIGQRGSRFIIYSHKTISQFSDNHPTINNHHISFQNVYHHTRIRTCIRTVNLLCLMGLYVPSYPEQWLMQHTNPPCHFLTPRRHKHNTRGDSRTTLTYLQWSDSKHIIWFGGNKHCLGKIKSQFGFKKANPEEFRIGFIAAINVFSMLFCNSSFNPNWCRV